jgi:hypothetical protein
MEIARLTAICRKSDCGDSEAKAEEEMEFSSQADAEGELSRARAELEEEKLKNAELDCKNDDLDSKVEHLEIEILVIKSKLASPPSPPPCEDCVVHEEDYKWLSDRYDEELDENLQQHQQIAELEEENEKLKDQMAMMAMEGHVAGFGGDPSAEEQAYQQAKQQRSS